MAGRPRLSRTHQTMKTAWNINPHNPSFDLEKREMRLALQNMAQNRQYPFHWFFHWFFAAAEFPSGFPSGTHWTSTECCPESHGPKGSSSPRFMLKHAEPPGDESYATKKKTANQSVLLIVFWVMVSKIFYFHPYFGKIPNLTNIFQRGWNHQPVFYSLHWESLPLAPVVWRAVMVRVSPVVALHLFLSVSPVGSYQSCWMYIIERQGIFRASVLDNK